MTPTQQTLPEGPLAQFGHHRLSHRLWRVSPLLHEIVSRLRDIGLIAIGRISVHRAWQVGYDNGRLSEFNRVVGNGGDLMPHLTALREARGALWELWPTSSRDDFEFDPAVKAIDAVLDRYQRGPATGSLEGHSSAARAPVSKTGNSGSSPDAPAMSMVERVARALAKQHNWADPDALATGVMPIFLHQPLGVAGAHLKLDDSVYQPLWQFFIPHAKAAIEAMRQPTTAMIEGPHSKRHMDSYSSNLEWWDAMIEAALK